MMPKEVVLQYEADVLEKINILRADQKEKVVVMVPLDNPYGLKSYGYTIGMTEFGFPEVIVMGPDPQNIGILIANVISQVLDTNKAMPNNFVVEDENVVVKSLRPHQVAKFTGPAFSYWKQSGKWPEFQQLVIPDRQGNKPDDPGYEQHYMTAHYGQQELWRDQSTLH